jgi:O-antigen ligase
MRADRAGAPAAGPYALAGTMAVLLGLAGGKWGAYLGRPPVFPIDVLLVLAGGHAMVGWLLDPAPGPAARWWPGWALTAFVGYPLARFLAGPDHSLTAIRDLAPYGYGLVGFLVARSTVGGGGAIRRRTLRLVDAALLFHLAWVALVLARPELPARLPLINAEQQLHLFDLRYASDGTVVGVTAALYFLRLIRDGGRRNLLILLAALAEVLTMASRASLLSTAVALAITFWLGCVRADQSVRARRRRLMLLALLPFGLVLAAVLVPHTTPGSKLLAGLGVTQAISPEDQVGLGTSAGRDRAWRSITDYVARTGHRGLGVGFGPDYLAASGARRPLGNSDLLRLPHSFVIGTYARLGLVGVVLLAWLVLALVSAMIRLRRRLGGDDLLVLAAVLPIAFLISGAVGVQIESPFGAVPFYWCLGLLLPAVRVPPGSAERGADAAAGVPVVGGPLGEVQEPAAGTVRPAGQLVGRFRVVRQDQRPV